MNKILMISSLVALSFNINFCQAQQNMTHITGSSASDTVSSYHNIGNLVKIYDSTITASAKISLKYEALSYDLTADATANDPLKENYEYSLDLKDSGTTIASASIKNDILSTKVYDLSIFGYKILTEDSQTMAYSNQEIVSLFSNDTFDFLSFCGFDSDEEATQCVYTMGDYTYLRLNDERINHIVSLFYNAEEFNASELIDELYIAPVLKDNYLTGLNVYGKFTLEDTPQFSFSADISLTFIKKLEAAPSI